MRRPSCDHFGVRTRSTRFASAEELYAALEQLLRQTNWGALDYLLSHWDGLTLFLRDGRVPWHNNTSERLLRHIAVGRHAWMFRGTFLGARRAAVLWLSYGFGPGALVAFGLWVTRRRRRL